MGLLRTLLLLVTGSKSLRKEVTMPFLEDRPAAPQDGILPFAVETLHVRGRVIRLGTALDTLIRRQNWPDPVARVVGEAAALAGLLGSSLKGQGRFQLQTRSNGPVSMVVIDLDLMGNKPSIGFRATAHFDKNRLEEAASKGQRQVAALLGEGHLALTIEQGSAANRYQGIVSLDGQGLEEAAHGYFVQSEQIPTRVRLAVGEICEAGRAPYYRAGGMLVQFLPGGRALDAKEAEECWTEASALTATLADHELVDPAIASETLLWRLFHEAGAGEGIRIFAPLNVEERCRCSRERVLGMIRSFSEKDRSGLAADDGTLAITCEFCGRIYCLEHNEIEGNEDHSG
jgi:molecular chaperone Hsp33